LRADGIPLDEAFNHLRKAYSFSSAGWASWGEGDRRRVLAECAAKGVPYPLSDAHMNVAHLHALFVRNARRVSLEEALGQLGLRFEGRPHSGADDAWNTARVLKRILGWPSVGT
ncbi:MAG: DNA polymerase III, partial [Deltaproteobacteria bacterium]|nr:DNA polymerase III [Deltaproteobacteria bacterium]